MALQTKVSVPTGVPGEVLARAIAIRLQDTADILLSGMPPEKYLGAVERYRVLQELMQVMEDYIAEQATGEGALDDE